MYVSTLPRLQRSRHTLHPRASGRYTFRGCGGEGSWPPCSRPVRRPRPCRSLSLATSSSRLADTPLSASLGTNPATTRPPGVGVAAQLLRHNQQHLRPRCLDVAASGPSAEIPASQAAGQSSLHAPPQPDLNSPERLPHQPQYPTGLPQGRLPGSLLPGTEVEGQSTSCRRLPRAPSLVIGPRKRSPTQRRAGSPRWVPCRSLAAAHPHEDRTCRPTRAAATACSHASRPPAGEPTPL